MVQGFQDGAFVEQLHVIDDPARGAIGVIALHSTALGPAAGGCRLWHYDTQQALATDAIRLARGMSYKNALAGLPFGGGKAVLMRPTGPYDRKALFEAFGEAVERQGGCYVTAEDVGTSVADMLAVAGRTRHVAGLPQVAGKAGGDPSPWTALGIAKSMEAAVREIWGKELRGLTVAVQGVGNVGARLCALLAERGAKLLVADSDIKRAGAVATRYDARMVSADDILRVAADILAPCALGAVFDHASIPELQVGLVCGGANNQLATEDDGFRLFERGIAYAPDYVVNAGGIINVAAEYLGESVVAVTSRIETIAERVANITSRSRSEERPPHVIADEMARSIITSARTPVL